MAKLIAPGLWGQVPSPFCGIGADDLTVRVRDGGAVTVEDNGDPVTRAGFEQPLGDKNPQIEGRAVPLEEAVTKAAELLQAAQLPLISGLAADVNGVRAALSLADRLGAVVDAADGEALLRNLLVLQDSGWMTCTLAEVKNRADRIVLVGSGLESGFPRFLERHAWVDGLFVQAEERRVVYLGQAPADAGPMPPGKAPAVLPCDDAHLPQVLAVLRALVKGETVTAEAVGGVPVARLAELAESLKAARYGVLVWAAASWNWPHAELAVQTLCELIKEVNRTTRCSGLPLGGKDGSQTATQVLSWQSGYPLRVRFSRGRPEYDPYLNATGRLLAEGEADVLLWLAAFNSKQTPPPTEVPTIVIGRCGMTFPRPPAVFIPVGCPGIDHAGHTYRSDNVIAIRLYQLRSVGLPSSAEVIRAIEQRL